MWRVRHAVEQGEETRSAWHAKAWATQAGWCKTWMKTWSRNSFIQKLEFCHKLHMVLCQQLQFCTVLQPHFEQHPHENHKWPNNDDSVTCWILSDTCCAPCWTVTSRVQSVQLGSYQELCSLSQHWLLFQLQHLWRWMTVLGETRYQWFISRQ